MMLTKARRHFGRAYWTTIRLEMEIRGPTDGQRTCSDDEGGAATYLASIARLSGAGRCRKLLPHGLGVVVLALDFGVLPVAGIEIAARMLHLINETRRQTPYTQ